MPALLTRMSILPKASTAVPMMRPAPSKSLTESWLGTAAPPAASISAQTSAAGSSPRALTAERDADVVDHDLGSLGGQAEGDVPPDAPTRTRHHCRTSVEKSHGARHYLGPVTIP